MISFFPSALPKKSRKEISFRLNVCAVFILAILRNLQTDVSFNVDLVSWR